MNKRTLRVTFFFFGFFLLSSSSGVFAASWDGKEFSDANDVHVQTGSSEQEKQKENSQEQKKVDDTQKVDDSKKNDTKTDVIDDSEEKEKVQKEINAYILEAYKIQWNKILKDIDISLQKINPDVETRIQAYARIQKTLEMRKKRVQNMDLSDNNKSILIKYLDYLVSILKRRQAELKD